MEEEKNIEEKIEEKLEEKILIQQKLEEEALRQIHEIINKEKKEEDKKNQESLLKVLDEKIEENNKKITRKAARQALMLIDAKEFWENKKDLKLKIFLDIMCKRMNNEEIVYEKICDNMRSVMTDWEEKNINKISFADFTMKFMEKFTPKNISNDEISEAVKIVLGGEKNKTEEVI
jgi:KaiC/GvpD/RAD55 family RecA-like ATPase